MCCILRKDKPKESIRKAIVVALIMVAGVGAAVDVDVGAVECGGGVVVADAVDVVVAGASAADLSPKYLKQLMLVLPIDVLVFVSDSTSSNSSTHLTCT